MHAAMFDHTSTVKLLIDKGANIEAVNNVDGSSFSFSFSSSLTQFSSSFFFFWVVWTNTFYACCPVLSVDRNHGVIIKSRGEC
jgi:hypothetical protein